MPGNRVNGCDEIRDRLLSHHEDELRAEERRRVEAHLATCAACAREARLLRRMDEVRSEQSSRGGKTDERGKP